MDIATGEEAPSDPRIGFERIARGVATFWAPPLAIAFLRLVIADGRRFATIWPSSAVAACCAWPIRYWRPSSFRGLVDETEISPAEIDAVVDGAVTIFLGHFDAR